LVAAAHFWIEGIGIFVLGVFGLAGNLLTIVTLSLIKSNKNFNKLLVIRPVCARCKKNVSVIKRPSLCRSGFASSGTEFCFQNRPLVTGARN
jgi:hypothetical protein